MVEYAVLIAVVCMALASMTIYVKRAIQGNLKESTTTLGGQFSADCSSSLTRRVIQSQRRQTVATNGAAESVLLAPEIIAVNGIDTFSNMPLVNETLF